MKKIVVFFLILSVGIVSAQYDKAKLQKESRALQSQIAKLNKSLKETRANSSKSILYLKQLKTKIATQQKLVNNTRKEKRLLEDEIYLSQLEINKLRREMLELKKEYKEVLVNAYKNKSLQNRVLFILASKNFTEAFRRVKYLEKYSGFQGEKADEIKEKEKAIEKKIEEREKAKNSKEILLAKRKVLQENLEKERLEQNKILASYRQNESNIKTEIKAKEKRNRTLDAKIEAIIKEEIRIAREKAEAERKAREEAARKERERLAKIEAARKAKEEAARKAAIAKAKSEGKEPEKPKEVAVNTPPPKPKPKPTKTYESRSTSEALASNFSASKGKLPWPVSKGEIVGKFGTQPHPLVPSTTINNSGVKIATGRGQVAKSVFKGTVTRVIAVQGGNKAVMVSHGSYFTVYNNLSSVYVSQGQTISAGQKIGTIYTDTDGNTILDFQIWKGSSKQNPAYWVRGM